MIDYETLVSSLRAAGHTVGSVTPVPANAGIGELEVDGRMITLEEARKLLEDAEPK